MEAAVEITAAVKNVPALRFQEFEGEWVRKSLGSFTRIYDGAHQTPKYTETGIPFYSVEQITADDFDNCKYISEEVFEKECKRVKIEKGDILMTRVGDVGTSKYFTWDVKASFYVNVALIKKSEAASNEFIDQYIKSFYFQKELYKRTIHVAFPKKINLGEIGNCCVVLPSISEQLKIASFLTSIDERIQKLRKKNALLEKYKKGVMQQIFSQQIRFKDDNGYDFPEWEIKKAKEVFKNHSNKKHNGDLPILAITQDKGTVLRDSIDIDIKSSEASIKSYKIIEEGDFIISLRSFQGGIEYSEITGICSPAYTVLKATIDINTTFFKYYFKKESFIKQLSNTVVGIRDGKQISYDAFSGMKLIFPSVAEQSKIGEFLTSIDNKINFISTQLEQAKQFKKGLLQQMFV
jgi:type I restriction enzyme, S subunit